MTQVKILFLICLGGYLTFAGIDTAHSAKKVWPVYKMVVEGDIDEVPTCILKNLKDDPLKGFAYSLTTSDKGLLELEGNFQNFFRYLINFVSKEGHLELEITEMSDSQSDPLKQALENVVKCSASVISDAAVVNK